MINRSNLLHILRGFALWCVLSQWGFATEIEDFYGDYVGEALTEEFGNEVKRDLSVSIQPLRKGDGFSVKWKTVIFKTDGRRKTQAYNISFSQTDRPHIYASAMKRNVFGGKVPLNPLQGDPFVWARIKGDTLTVFALLIDDEGEYQMQIYDRTLNDHGLWLEFRRRQEDEETRRISTQLKRTD